MNHRVTVNELAIKATGGVKPFALQDTTYMKGPNKGKHKSYWLLNDAAFMELWEAILPYVQKSVHRSAYYADSLEREDLLATVRLRLLICLRNYGPNPHKQPFSKYLPLFINNVLTNGFDITLREKSRINYEAISLFDQAFDGDSPTTIAAVTPDNNIDYSRDEVELTAHLCKQEQAIVLYYLNTENKSETARHFHISYHKLQKILRRCVERDER